jgi:hypothetical protein
MRRRSTPTLRTAALTFGLAIGAAATPAVAGAAHPAAVALPAQDPFYKAPADLASLHPGQVVRSRPVAADDFGGPSTVRAWQIAFRSNDAHGRAELGVTTLVVPTAAWKGKGPRPAVSVEAAEDGDGLQCAPSYEISTNTDVADAAQAARWLSIGYAAAFPDDEGPQSVFLAGPEEAHVVLDGIRAVQRFDHAGIGTANKWALDGYSGGANSAGWAAQLQPSYAPGIKLVGAAIGGTPADPAAVAQSLDGGVASGLEFAAAASIAVEWPEAHIARILTAKGTAAFAKIQGECAEKIILAYALQKLSSYTKVADPLDVPSVKKILTLDTLGATPPKAPVYDYHADTDEIVPVAQDNALVAKWCHEGAKVDAIRDIVGEHGEEVVVRYPSVQSWITDRFNGRKSPTTC